MAAGIPGDFGFAVLKVSSSCVFAGRVSATGELLVGLEC